MSIVLQVLDIVKIWICHIFDFYWLPKVTSTLSKWPAEHYGSGNNNKVYLNITDYLYPLVHVIYFILILNLHFWNYYLPLRAYSREPPFNHLDSTSSESTFLCILAHNCHFLLFAGRTTGGKLCRSHVRALLPNLPTPETSRPIPSPIYSPPR